MEVREWVLTEEGRSGRIGALLPCRLCRMPRIPPEASEYKRTAVFDATTTPAGLRKSHTTKADVWGEIVVLEYYARVSEKRPFVALQKLVFERVGKAVVWRGEGTPLTTVETTVAETAKALGSTWTKTPPLGSREPPKKGAKTRPAKPGELDALAVHKHLSRIIEGNDPLARGFLKRELERTTPAVRTYAASLMEGGPRSDTAIAKELACPVSEVVTSRELLSALLRGIK